MPDKRTLVSPTTLRCISDTGSSRSLHRRWRSLTLRVDDFELVREMTGLERVFEFSLQSDVPDPAQETESNILSTGERIAIDERQLREVRPSGRPPSYRLTGWGRVENDRLIRVVSADRDGSEAPNYEARFWRIRLNLRAVDEEDHLGSLLLVGPELRAYDTDDEKEDYITLDVAVRRSTLKQLALDVGNMREPPALRMHVQALLFQDRVEEALAEHWHSQEFVMLNEGAARAYLERIFLPSANRKAAAIEKSRSTVLDDADRPAATPAPIASTASDVGKRIGSLTTAVWCLVAAVIVAAALL